MKAKTMVPSWEFEDTDGYWKVQAYRRAGDQYIVAYTETFTGSTELTTKSYPNLFTTLLGIADFVARQELK